MRVNLPELSASASSDDRALYQALTDQFNDVYRRTVAIEKTLGMAPYTIADSITASVAVGDITGLGTGVATWLATPSSANLRGAVTDETGAGLLVFADAPTFSGLSFHDKGLGRNNTSVAGDYTVVVADTHLVCNGGATITLTLPSAAIRRELTVRTTAAFTVVSASANVVPLVGGAAGTAILAATAGKWAYLISDGTNWLIQAAN